MPRLLIRSHSDPSQLPVAKYGDSRHRAAPEGRVGSGDIAGHFGAQVVKDGRLPSPIAQLSTHIRSSQEDGLDNANPLTWPNATPQDAVDHAARSLKVATRVRIPLWLQNGLFPIGRASVIRVGS